MTRRTAWRRPLAPASQVPAFNWITPNIAATRMMRRVRATTCRAPSTRTGHRTTRGRSRSVRPRSDDADQLHGWPLRVGPVPSLLHSLIEQSKAFADGGLIDVTFDEANPPSRRQQLQQRSRAGDVTTSGAPGDQPTFGASGTTAPGHVALTVPTASWPTLPVRTSTARTSRRNQPDPTTRSDQRRWATVATRSRRIRLH